MMSKQHRSSWSDLPSELMELILPRLTLIDYLKCCKVCQSWRAMVNDAISTKGRFPPKPQFPFLLSSPTSPYLPPTLLSLTENRLYNWPTPHLDEELFQFTQRFNEYHYAYQFSSVDGWLIIQDYYNDLTIGLSYGLIYFCNPVSSAMFMLPKLSLSSSDHDHYQTYRSSKLAVSSKPDCTDLIVASLVSIKVEGQLKQQLSFCKVMNKSWTRIEIQESRTMFFLDIVIHGSKLYATTDDDDDGLFDFVKVFNLSNHNAVTYEKLVILDPKQRFIFTLPYFKETSYIVIDSTCGDLLLVVCQFRCDWYVKWPIGFRVFKLDMNGPKWLKVDNLSDRVLLLDDTGMIQVIYAKNLDGPWNSIRDNCVYYCLSHKLPENSLSAHDIGVFSLTDNSATSFPSHPSSQVSGQNLWFTPSLW